METEPHLIYAKSITRTLSKNYKNKYDDEKRATFSLAYHNIYIIHDECLFEFPVASVVVVVVIVWSMMELPGVGCTATTNQHQH